MKDESRRKKLGVDQGVTRLSKRDGKLLASILADESSKPNAALVAAAKRYKKQVRK